MPASTDTLQTSEVTSVTPTVNQTGLYVITNFIKRNSFVTRRAQYVFLILFAVTSTPASNTSSTPTALFCVNGTHVLVNGSCVDRLPLIVR